MADRIRGQGEPSAADELLHGAIDVHHHGYPEISFDLKTRYEDVHELRLARDAGMAAIVLKSHMWPTVGRAYHLRHLVPGIESIPSITLNPIVGGFSPMAVESAARQGAAFLFMPTWGAAHDVSRSGMSNHMRHILQRVDIPGGGLRLTEEGDRLKPEVSECLAVAAEYGMAVASGHVSPRESMVLAAGAKEHGIDTILFQHPDSNSVKASRDEIREMARLGATVEICALGLLPAFQRISVNEVMEIVAEVTPAQCVLTTDYFFDWAPSAPETLRMLIGILLSRGVSAEDIRTMVRDVPRRLLSRRKVVQHAELGLAAE
jgi:hypothetical protein